VQEQVPPDPRGIGGMVIQIQVGVIILRGFDDVFCIMLEYFQKIRKGTVVAVISFRIIDGYPYMDSPVRLAGDPSGSAALLHGGAGFRA